MGPPGLAGPPGESGREVSRHQPHISVLSVAVLAFARASLPLADAYLSASLCRDLLVLKAPLDEMVLLAPR